MGLENKINPHVAIIVLNWNEWRYTIECINSILKNEYVNYLGYTHVAHEGSYSFGNQRETFVRHCIEHMAIAKQYLAQPHLTMQQTLFLMIWYNDQSARLFLHQLLARDVCTAFKTSRNGMSHYPFMWPVILCISSCRILIKRSVRLCRSLFVLN